MNHAAAMDEFVYCRKRSQECLLLVYSPTFWNSVTSLLQIILISLRIRKKSLPVLGKIRGGSFYMICLTCERFVELVEDCSVDDAAAVREVRLPDAVVTFGIH